MRFAALATVACLVAGAALALPPSTDQYLASLARTTGQMGAFWQADVWIYNPSASQSASVTVYLLRRGQENATPQQKTLNVAAGATLELIDFFDNANGFDVDTYVGGMRLTSTIPVVVTARSYNINAAAMNGGTGTTGQFYPGLAATHAIGVGQNTDIVGLAHDTTWRSNLDLIETTGNQVTLVVDRLDPATGAVLGSSSPITLRAREAQQLTNLMPAYLGTATATNVRVRVRPTSGTGRVLVTASRIDNRTNDAVTIEMTTAASGGGNSTGVFDGVVISPAGTTLDGGMRTTVSSSGITDIDGLAGLDCGTYIFTLEFGDPLTTPATIGADGSFTVQYNGVAYNEYSGGPTIFTIDWTVVGQLSNGVLSGTVSSVTSGGTGDYAGCNGTTNRTFRAGWAGNS